MTKRTCTVCNLTLDGTKRKYCSRQCASRALTLHRIATGHRTDRNHPKVCELCAVEFKGRTTSRFCSLACQHAGTRASRAATYSANRAPGNSLVVYYKPRVWLGHRIPSGIGFTNGRCADCGQTFTRESLIARYCSDRCSQRAKTRRAHTRRGEFNLPPSIRMGVVLLHGAACHLCATPIDDTAHPNSPLALTMDHLVPRSTGDTPDDSPSNLRPAHRYCNSTRGNRPIQTPDFYRERLDAFLAVNQAA